MNLDLSEIQHASLEELRAIWRRHYGPPPRIRSPHLLRYILAWRSQATEEGGLDAQTRALLRKVPSNRETLLAPGTLIAREWKGERHEVQVTEDGFLYNGREWRSLSEVARSIAGTRWNGPKFFGLRKIK